MSVLTLHQPDADEPTCTLLWLRRQLGRQDLTPGRFVRMVEALIANSGFPPPLPSFSQSKGLVLEVNQRSCWIRVAVEAWLQDFLPPANACAIDAAAMREAASDLDAAAANLGKLHLIQGGRA